MLWRDKKVNFTGKYARVWWPDHPEATKHGLVAIHRVLVYESLGRKLEPEEFVRCINGDLKDLSPSNWEVGRRGLTKAKVCLCGSLDTVRKGRCKECRNAIARARYAEKRKEISAAVRKRRQRNRPQAVLSDARRFDKKKGLFSEVGFIDYTAVSELLKQPCSYCGDTTIQRTLDRIDNTKGHLLDNVVTACIRCNLLRRDMPFRAWLVVAEGVKKARIEGLFEAWTGAIH